MEQFGIYKRVHAPQLVAALADAGLPVLGVQEAGELRWVQFSRPLTEAERAAAHATCAAHRPTPDWVPPVRTVEARVARLERMFGLSG